MRSIESSAKTIEDAIRQGLEKLDVSLGDVTIDILQEGSKGFLGFMGGKEAKVRLTVKDDDQHDDILSTFASCPVDEEEPVAASPIPVPKQKQPPKHSQPQQQAEPKQKAEPQKKAEAQPKAQPQPKAAHPHKPEPQKKADSAVKPAKAAVKEQKAPELQSPLKITPVSDPESTAGKAQEFLVNVTRLMNLDVTVEAGFDEEGNVYANIQGDTLGILIGRRGETLDALQYLTSLNINHGQEGYTRVTLDTENYRAKREEALKRLANRMANRAVKTGRKVVMEPMNPYERRILHSALQQNTAVTTHSEGDEPNRHVVITLK